ncbi:MAG: PAS domain S-box protein [bacterium]
MKNKIQTRLILLLCFIILIFIVVLLLINNFEKHRVELLVQEQSKSKELFFNKIITLKESSLANFAYDYSYWDEMVSFVHTGNKIWAKQNIDDSLSTYKSDAVWIYDAKWELIHSAYGENIRMDKELPLQQSIHSELFKKSPFIHFYINTAAGLLEIHGASIHPTSDKDRKTPAQGYLFVGRLWNPSFLQELAELTDSQIKLSPVKTEAVIKIKDNLKTGTINFNRILLGWNNQPVMQVLVLSKLPIIQSLIRSSKNELLLLIGFTSILLLIIIIFLTRWISNPLRLISRSLTLQNPDIIAPLQTDSTEFGYISKLITTFFTQQNELVKEMADRKEMERKLQNNFQFLQTLLDAIPSPVFYKNTSGIFLGCNKAYEQFMRLPKDQIIGNHIYGIIPNKNLADVYHQADLTLLQNPGLQQYETSGISPDGSSQNIIIYKATYNNTEGKVAGLIGTILDITELKRIETTLRKTDQVLRAIINSAPVAIFSLDRVGKVIMWNSSAERIFGWKEKGIIGMQLPIIPEDTKNEFYALFTRVLNGDILTNIELQQQTNNKTVVYVSLSAAPLYDSTNKTIGIMVIMADITERKQAEAAIAEAQQRYESLVNNLPIGIYRNTPGPQGRFLAVNPAIVEMFEAKSQEEFIDLSVNEQYVDPKKRNEFSEKIMQQGYVKDEELELITFKGKKFWASVTAVMKKDKDGQIYFDGMLRDITDWKLAIQQVKESEERFRIISSSAQDAIIMLDEQGNVSYWNPAAENIFGYTRDEIFGKNFHALIAPERYHAAHNQAFHEWQKTGEGNTVGKTIELSAIQKDGTEISVELSLSSVKVREKWQAIGILRDITDRKKMEEQLRVLSLTDSLTGLANRRGFMNLAEQQIKIANRLKQELCLFYIDLDQMKWINDTLGHKEGDRALIDTANALRTTFRAADIIGRIGGDEFVGLAIESKETTVDQIMARLQEHLNALNTFGKRAYQLSLSIGIMRYDPNQPVSLETLVEQGDKLMYEQKRKKKLDKRQPLI